LGCAGSFVAQSHNSVQLRCAAQLAGFTIVITAISVVTPIVNPAP